jgi:signal transduction histidine kinase
MRLSAPVALLPAGVRRVPWPSLVVALLAVLTAAGAAALLSVRGGWSLPGAAEVPVDLAVATAYPLTGLLVLAGPRSARLLGRLLLAVGVASAVSVLSTVVAVTASEPSPAAGWAVWVHSWVWVPGFFPLLTLLPLVYPDGRLLSRRWRPAAVAACGGTVLVAAATALHDDRFSGRVELSKPYVSDAVAVPLGVTGAVLLTASALAALASLGLRLRRSSGLARRQVAVLGAAAAVLLVQAVLDGRLPSPADAVTQVVAVVLLPVAVGIAATRHRLYDLDVAVLRALVGLSLGLSLAGICLTSASLLAAVLPEGSVLVPALSAALTGVLVQPLAARLSRAADRFWYGERTDPYAALAGLSARLREGVEPERVPDAVCSAVVAALRLGGARLVLGTDPSARPVAQVGLADGPGRSYRLQSRGALVGWLSVVLQAGEQRLDARDEALLTSLCDQAAPALAALGLSEQLRRSREALVAAREEERRRLRRDLHDGVGAALAGARLQLESARELADDGRVVRMLDAAGRAVSEAVDDVRRLTDDLRPPALDELGLGDSLRGLAQRVATPSLRVTAELTAVPTLPAAVEVACYRIAAEALTNAARHAGARSVSLRLVVEPDDLVVEVADDGCGLPRQRTAGRSGLGLESMRQRAEEVGGELALASDVDGTTVRARLPRRVA